VFARAIKLTGVLFLACGIALGAFLTYEFVWTNNESAQIQKIERDAVLYKWSTNTTSPFGETERIPPVKGETIALMYIPQLRNQVWGTPVLEGVDAQQLSGGIGHYPLTADPGQVGNFVTFGHRTTHGQPYAHVELLEVGDQVFVQTEKNWFIYTLTMDGIVLPTDTWVMRSKALENARVRKSPSNRIITLITCTPRHSTKQRWVWWGQLTEVRDAGDSPL
jgi:sortase A